MSRNPSHESLQNGVTLLINRDVINDQDVTRDEVWVDFLVLSESSFNKGFLN